MRDGDKKEKGALRVPIFLLAEKRMAERKEGARANDMAEPVRIFEMRAHGFP